ncbi:TPA: hypothetical protein NGI80_000187 [Legionella pneumophila]|nr:hypothetical protein [Legionella pneumophila]
MQIIKWDKLIPSDLNTLILGLAPTKVRNRYLKAMDHYKKSLKLIGLDDEMAFIRFVASEEEIVVAIFEQLKLKKFSKINFTTRFKNHCIKISLAPVIDFFTYLLADMKFFGDSKKEETKLVVEENSVRLLIKYGDKKLISPIPDDVILEEKNVDNTVEHWYRCFLKSLPKKCTVQEFISSRANARNKILYAEDGRSYVLPPIDAYIEIFQREIVLLCWALGILLDDDIPTRDYKLINLMISVYEKILIEAKQLKGN